MDNTYRSYIYHLVIAVTVILLLFLIWKLTDLWLLVFGSMLVAMILRAVTIRLERYLHVPSRWSLAMAGILILALILLAFFLAGSVIQEQIDTLFLTIPQAWDKLKSNIKISHIGTPLSNIGEHIAAGKGVLAGVSNAVIAIANSFTDFLLIIFGGVYLAARPQFYKEGLLKLIPPGRSRRMITDTVEDCKKALGLWLKGQMISMMIVFVLITSGLWLIGMPSALALGLLAGLGEFVPLIGTLFAAFPALLLALTQGTESVLWVLGVYVAVQQLQGNVIMPLIQNHMVYLPPALTLFSLMAFTLLFGPLGLLFAAPITVVVYVMVKSLYISKILGEETAIPGKDH